MTDFKPRTPNMIDIHDSAEREHWARTWDVPVQRLRKACTMVGTRISSVKAYLSK